MSYVFNKEVKLQDNFTLDATGRLRASQLEGAIEVLHVYGKNDLLIDEVVGGSATSVFSDSTSSVDMTIAGATTSYVIRQTKKRGFYHAGKSLFFEASFKDFDPVEGITKRVGYFSGSTAQPYNSSLDGFFLESSGATVSFQIWRQGTLVESTPSASWSTMDYNPSAIDWSKVNLMGVDFQWLGAGRVRFGLFIDGTFKQFHTFSGANNITDVYMKSPHQPIRYEIRSTGATASGSFSQICSQVSVEGSLNQIFSKFGIYDFTERTLTTGGTKYAYMGLRMNPSYMGASVLLDNLSLLQTTNDNYLLTIELNPTLGSTATFIGLTGSPIEYSTGDPITVSSSGTILYSAMGKAGTLGTSQFDLRESSIYGGIDIDGTPDQVWICITPVSGTAKFYGATNLIAYF